MTIAANGSPAWRALFSRIAVEHDDRVVDAEADDGQHRGHEQRVDLDVEERAEDGEDPDDDDDVVEQRDERGHAELDVAEPVGDPEQDPDRADEDEDERLA